jgi:hypothetical protein
MQVVVRLHTIEYITQIDKVSPRKLASRGDAGLEWIGKYSPARGEVHNVETRLIPKLLRQLLEEFKGGTMVCVIQGGRYSSDHPRLVQGIPLRDFFDSRIDMAIDDLCGEVIASGI